MQKIIKNKLLAPLCALLMLVVLLPWQAHAEGAATPTVTGEPYYGTNYVQFTINQNGASGAWFFDVQCGDTLLYKHVLCDFTDGKNAVGFDNLTAEQAAGYQITVYQGFSAKKSARKVTADVTVITADFQDAAGNTTAAGVPVALYPAMGSGAVFQPNTAYYYDGTDYDLSASTDGGTKLTYRPHTDSLSGSVTLVGNDGTVLQTTELEGITAENPQTVALPETIEHDGQTYVRPEGLASVTAKYNGQVNFTITYTRSRVEGEGAYKAIINFCDGQGTVLATDTVNVNKLYRYTAPQEFSVTDAAKGVTTLYSLNADQQAVLTLRPGDAGEAKEYTYTLQYTAVNPKAQNVPWVIVRVNGVTGQEIDRTRLEVLPDGTNGSYHAEALELDGVTYEPVGGSDYTYTRGSSPVLTIYYVPQGYTPEESYELTLQCVDIAANTVLSSRTITVQPGADTQLTSTASLTVNGQEYVRLGGQVDSWTHNYYSPRRVYTVYYRGINDSLYVDTTVTEIVTVTTTRTETNVIYETAPAAPAQTEETIVYDGEAEQAETWQAGMQAGETLTAAGNAATGRSNLRTDAGQSTAEAREKIEDNETPLAGPSAAQDGSGAADTALQQSAFTADLPMTLALIGVSALILLLIVLIIRQRRENRRARR